MPKKLTTKSFIKKANKIHGDKYDYSLVNYITNKLKVIIICPEHGEFEQPPHGHLKGYGCYECGKKISRKVTTYEFIERSKEIHNNKFDYSLTELNGVMNKVKIICPKHGVFNQAAYGHLSGRGCNTCKSSNGEETKKYGLKRKIDKFYKIIE